MSDMTGLKKTPFYDIHVKYGAKLVPFAGYIMPVQYEGILDEHKTVREAVGLFDVSHMGEIFVTGEFAVDAVNHIVTNDVRQLKIGQALYTPMMYPHGGIVDDLLVYKCAENRLLLVVNASNVDKDYAWICENLIKGAKADNQSENWAQLALQGRYAEKIIKKLSEYPVESIAYYHFAENVTVAGANVLLSRTGYTGEDGFELYFDPKDAEKVYLALMTAGEEFGIKPIGLGARDTLRLESRMVLYGNDITDKTNPVEAGIGWTVKLDKEEFIGKDRCIEDKAAPKRRLVGLKMLEPGIPRQHYPVFVGEADETASGEVTSGTMSPTLKEPIALAYVPFGSHKEGTEIWVEIHKKRRKAVVVKTPFYKRSY